MLLLLPVGPVAIVVIVIRHLRITIVIQIGLNVDPDCSLFEMDSTWRYITFTLNSLVNYLSEETRDRKSLYVREKWTAIAKAKEGTSEQGSFLASEQSRGRNFRIETLEATGYIRWVSNMGMFSWLQYRPCATVALAHPLGTS